MKSLKEHLPIIITIGMLIIFGVSYLVVGYVSSKNASTIAEIYQDSELIKVVDLSVEDTFTITLEDGSYNIVNINENGEIAIIDASCPDKTCVHTGYTKTPAKPIICLPNRLEIKIILKGDASSEDEIDSFAY